MLKKRTPDSRRRMTGWLLSALTALLLTSEPVRDFTALPDSIRLTRGSGAAFALPSLLEADVQGEAAALSSMDESLSDQADNLYLNARQAGSAFLTVRLMGLLPLKTIPVSVEESRVLIPGGMPVGVAIRTQGVLVVGASDLGGATKSPAREAGLQPGDLICEVDGVPVTGSSHLSSLISSGEAVILTVERDDDLFSLPLTPVIDPRDGAYRLGAWVRDSTAGVGTLSFYDPATNRFGALGHAITDVDTGQVLDVQNGEIVESRIVEIHKGESGEPGELVGQFGGGSHPLGEIETNGVCGIYGSAYEPLVSLIYPDGLPIASRDEIHTGPAQLLTTLDDSGSCAYDCEIIKIARQPSSRQRSMLIEITDPELLERTGGIVQGMSGSPIIQDGKLVGAVTHVLVNDPTRGYGIFIENMLDAAG
jgi:stage IV sporulation protein B